MLEIKYLILGAGVSGLSFANFINDSDFLIIEKDNSIGGYCKTTYVNDFVWDYSGHFFHFKNNTIRDFFLTQIQTDEIIQNNKNTGIYYHGKIIDFPFQKNIHQLDKEEFIECLVGLVQPKNDTVDNFKEMLYQKFGKGISEKFLIPYNEKLYATNLKNLDTDAMGRFFPHADLHDIMNNFYKKDTTSYNETFLYPKKGAQVFVNCLGKNIPATKINLNEEVISINHEKKIVKTSKNEYKYTYLINSIPFDKLMQLSNINHSIPLTYNKVLVFNIGFDKPSIDSGIHWLYFPQQEINFYRVGFYNNILNQDKLSIYVEIGFSSSDPLNIEEQLKLTLENLKKVNIISDHQILAYQSIVMNPAYVHISKDSLAIYEYYNLALNTKNIHNIGRYAQWKYCSIEDCIIEAQSLASLLTRI